MPATTAPRRLDAPENQTDFRRWRSRFFVFLAFAVFVALSAFVPPQQTRVLIRPTGPLPAVNAP